MEEKAPSLKVPPVNWARVLGRVAARGKALIIRRAFPATGAGKSSKNKKFKRLNPAYAKKKREAGRQPVANQRFTSRTASAFGVVKQRFQRNGGMVVLGFRTRRAIAEKLQRRNEFINHTKGEEKLVLAVMNKELQDHAAKVKVENGRIVMRLEVGKR